MDATQDEKLRQVLFERLTLGESQEKLHADLRRRLDDDTAGALLAKVIDEIAARRRAGDYEPGARRLRKKRFGSPYLAWRIFGGFLLVVGVANSIVSIANTGAPYVAFFPLAAGLAIFAIVEDKVHRKVLTAATAVDGLFEDAVRA